MSDSPFGAGSSVPLADEFEGWTEQHPELGLCIRHPLYFSIPHHSELNDHANQALHHKIQALATAKEEKKWHLWLILHERPWRLQAFTEIHEQLDDEDYWSLLAHVWIDSENIWQNEEEWVEYLLSVRDGSEQMMDADDRKLLAELPDPVPVYRGFKRRNREQAISWTLDRERAEWFARRWNPDRIPRVAIGTVAKSEIIAVLSNRDESEVLVKAESVAISEVLQLEPGEDQA